jgi:formamidopyrimidine-DNA glycosylase
MPELPEVETVRRKLAPAIEGRKIARVETAADSYFFLTRPARLKRELPNRRIVDLRRLGKYLIAKLDDDRGLLLHLGMTGQLFLSDAPKLDPHMHLRLAFADGPPQLVFRDVRKFGKVALIKQLEREPRIAKLGVDALQATGRELWQQARHRKIPVKTLLLDQGVLAGVGNIYADEALFGANIRPTRPARRLSLAHCEKLVGELRRVLECAIDAGGSSISDYLQPDGAQGEYQNQHLVYGRTGQPCPKCHQPIQRRMLGGRSTHWCNRCQS